MSTGTTSAGMPQDSAVAATRWATSAVSAWSPWSAVTALARSSPRRWRKAQAWSSAIESAPPDTATISPGTAKPGAPLVSVAPLAAVGPPAGVIPPAGVGPAVGVIPPAGVGPPTTPAGVSGTAARQSLTALRTAALAGSRVGRRGGEVCSTMDAIEPELRFVDLCGARQVGRFVVDAGEAPLPDLAADGADELRPVTILGEFEVHPQQVRQEAALTGVATGLELPAQSPHARDHPGPDFVHDDIGMPFEQRQDRGRFVEGRPRLLVADEVDEAGLALEDAPDRGEEIDDATDPGHSDAGGHNAREQ